MARTRAASRRASVLGRGDLSTSLVLIFPLLVAYGVGVMFSTTVNGVDFLTRTIYAAVGYDSTRYLIVHLVLAVGYLGYLLYLWRTRTFSLGIVVPVVLESAIYALTLGTFIVFVMYSLLGFGGALAVGAPLALGPIGEAIVISLGAGVHEELVFRLGLMAGLAALVKRAGLPHGWAVLVGLAVSSVLFSAAHHVGPMGDPLDSAVFTYRALAGVIFGLIFYYRSLAHAVYTHVLYDVYVLVLRA
jgi:hypothetical protein